MCWLVVLPMAKSAYATSSEWILQTTSLQARERGYIGPFWTRCFVSSLGRFEARL